MKGETIKDKRPKPSPGPAVNSPKYNPETIIDNPNINLNFSINVGNAVLFVNSAR
jgi:hypothetical protein